ncbi:Protein of unknown function [Gryllus bimaculatus]|nr:Protein of unknown function [Gryllus bimaculatus]
MYSLAQDSSSWLVGDADTGCSDKTVPYPERARRPRDLPSHIISTASSSARPQSAAACATRRSMAARGGGGGGWRESSGCAEWRGAQPAPAAAAAATWAAAAPGRRAKCTGARAKRGRRAGTPVAEGLLQVDATGAPWATSLTAGSQAGEGVTRSLEKREDLMTL